MVTAQTNQVVIVQPSVVVLIDRCYVMNLNRLIVQPINGVIDVVQATLAKVSIPCPYLYAFECPCLGLTEAVTLPVTALLSALFVWALMSSLNHTAVSASH